MFTLPHRLAFILTLLLNVLLLTACGGGGGGGGTSDDADGDGYANSVDVDDDNNGLIEISSLEQLDWMRNDLAGTSLTDNDGNVDTRGCPVDGCHGYELVADLDFDTNGNGVMDSKDTYYNNGKGWLPIGNDKLTIFTADFNGNGHSIHNLYINRTVSDAETGGIMIGLFGYVYGRVNTITLNNIVLDGNLMSVTGNDSTGGLAGAVANATINNITITGTISGTTNTGGVLGAILADVSIKNCTTNGTINGIDNTGGLIGTTAAFLANPGYVNPSITDSQVHSLITGKTYTGVFVGREYQNVTITNSSATGQEDSDYDGDGVRNGVDVDDDNDGLIDIASLQQLDWMRNDLAGTSLNDGVGNADNTGCPTTGCHGYELDADLDFDTNGDGVMDANDTYDNNGSGWLPIGDSASPFIADFNGNGHSIHHLSINRPNASNNGLFGVVDGTNSANVIQDVQLVSTQVTGNVNTGGLVGLVNNNSTISYCSASGVVTGTGSVGGLVGGLTGASTISNSTASGAVNGTNNTGGLVGSIGNSSISNSAASVAVTGSGDITGGLVGNVGNSSISNSTASGVIKGNTRAGGLVGYSGGSAISNSVASGSVEGANSTGGLVGEVYLSTISSSAASSAVTGNGDYTGGLLGSATQLTLNNSFATGVVVGVNYVGGLIGNAINSNNTITYSFATGEVTGASGLGALVGKSNGATYTANYFAKDKGVENALGVNSAVGGINPAGTTGATLVELQCPTTANDTTCAASLLYQNWDTALWDFGSSTLLPGLIIGGKVYRDGDGNGVLD